MTSHISVLSAKISTVWLCCLFLLCINAYSQSGQRTLPGSKAQSSSPARETCNKTPSRTICVDYSRDGGRFPAAWQYVSNLSPSNGPISDRLVKKLGIRYSRMFYAVPIWSCGDGCYNFTAPENYKIGWGDDLQIEAIMAQGALPILNIGGVPGWLGGNVNGPPLDYGKYQTLWKAALQHIAIKYPKVYYLEAFNDPEYGKITSTDVDKMYLSLVET